MAWNKIRTILGIAERAHWLYTLLPTSILSLAAGVMGYLQGLPWMYIYIGVVAVFVLILEVRHRLHSFTDEEKAKREAFFSVCANTYMITEGYVGNREPFYYALNQARILFQEDDEVTRVYEKLVKEPGHEQILIPELIVAMGKAAAINVNEEHLKRPLGPGRN